MPANVKEYSAELNAVNAFLDVQNTKRSSRRRNSLFGDNSRNSLCVPGTPTTPICPGCGCRCENAKSMPKRDGVETRLQDVKLCIEESMKAHHTGDYELAQGSDTAEAELIVRRGQEFAIQVYYDEPPDKNRDDIRVILNLGPSPKVSTGTSVILHYDNAVNNLNPKCWGMKVSDVIPAADNPAQHIGTFTIMPPATCSIGRWALLVQHREKAADSKKWMSIDKRLYILCNPWCEADLVYMPDEEERAEYVMNDVGKIWCGTKKRLRYRAWNFGQFEDVILDTCMLLLDKAELPYSARGDPIKLVRAVSAVVNAPSLTEQAGVLEGNWSGDYNGGTSPSQWQGSVKILHEFYTTHRPVKWGQCWVFSGVVTTVLRCLGIPARSVTNFASAHDTNSSITIDYHYDDDLKPIDDFNHDSIWNFHVWNEAWMARLDLPKGYGGWQALDATPQELSDGEYKCGPASVLAIRKGEVHYSYDTPFIFSEVNADIIHWMCKSEGDMEKCGLDTKKVGQFISTKKPGPMKSGGGDRLDVTDLYKPPNRSTEERIAVLNAMNRSESSALSAYKMSAADVEFEFVDIEDVSLGASFSVVLRMTNSSSEKRNVSVTLNCSTAFYTGVVADRVRSDHFDIVVPPSERAEVCMPVEFEDYMDLLCDQAAFQIGALAKVTETNQVFCDQDDFRLRMPDITIDAPGSCKLGETFTINCSFKNPLPKRLHKCKWILEGPGLESPRTVDGKEVEKSAAGKISMELKAKKLGHRTILVSFESVELGDVDGSETIEVLAA